MHLLPKLSGLKPDHSGKKRFTYPPQAYNFFIVREYRSIWVLVTIVVHYRNDTFETDPIQSIDFMFMLFIR